jgi:alkyldihydroxyacetonephosphate synthase
LTLLKNAWQIKDFEPLPLADLTKVAAELRKPRFKLTKRIQAFCTDDAEERMRHSYGQAFRDLVRALQGQYDNPPDYVAFPRSESQLLSLFAFSKKRKIALIPYGGGTSVVGGVEPPRHSNYPGVISVDMKYFDKLLRVDKESLIARVQAGIYGPDLIEKLKAHGVTLRHFPQSFEFSTVGGWIATRAGGHYATLKTHIDDVRTLSQRRHGTRLTRASVHSLLFVCVSSHRKESSKRSDFPPQEQDRVLTVYLSDLKESLGSLLKPNCVCNN